MSEISYETEPYTATCDDPRRLVVSVDGEAVVTIGFEDGDEDRLVVTLGDGREIMISPDACGDCEMYLEMSWRE